MEGPSLVILKEEVRQFKGKKIRKASGYADIDYKRLVNRTVRDFKTWGKHFLIVLPGLSVRVHFLLFGTYYINERKNTNPKLSLYFSNGALHCYVCSVKFIEEPLTRVYDWSLDLLSPKWNYRKVRTLLMEHPHQIICDAVMDPAIFGGAGNIIKNEALYRAGIHPESMLDKLPAKKLNQLIHAIHDYSWEFLRTKKKNKLSTTWYVYSRKTCRKCGSALKKKYTGKLKRRSFTCPQCQEIYK